MNDLPKFPGEQSDPRPSRPETPDKPGDRVRHERRENDGRLGGLDRLLGLVRSRGLHVCAAENATRRTGRPPTLQQLVVETITPTVDARTATQSRSVTGARVSEARREIVRQAQDRPRSDPTPSAPWMQAPGHVAVQRPARVQVTV